LASFFKGAERETVLIFQTNNSMNSADTEYRVLVVDDNPAIHEDFRKVLCLERFASSRLEAAENALFGAPPENAGKQRRFQIDSAHQGQEGLAKMYHAIQQEGRPYAMAFVDVRMPPGWDGIEVIPRLWVADPNLSVIICTAYSDYSWEEIFAKLGNTDRLFILKKPFDRIELLQLAHTLAERFRLRTMS
jgi:CheY-like chemotaxis protein